MEVDSEKSSERQQKSVSKSLVFCWDELISNLMRSLQDLASYKGVPPEVCLRLGEEEMMLHAVLLAALSSWWRKRLDPLLQQDTLIIHNITVDFQPADGVLYATRSLLYSGCMTIASSLLEQVQRVTRSLNLDSHELTYSLCSNGMYSVQWKGFREHLLKALQYMCCNQLCTDVAVVVNGYIIKAHKLVLGASSPVLNSAFQEDRRIRIIHLPGIKVKIAQSLITYMYFGKTSVQKDMLVEFHKLCGVFEVESLQELTKRFAEKVSGNSEKGPEPRVTIHARVRPEAKDLWGRLQQYYTVGRNADLMLIVENKIMLAHKTLCSAICPPIHELLVQEFSNEHALVMIANMNHSLWEGILNIMYRGSCTIVGTAISTVFSYIDLSLFDIEVNEVQPPPKCQEEYKNPGYQIPSLINQRLSLDESSVVDDKELNVKKRRKSASHSEKAMDDIFASKQNANGKRVSRLNASFEDQDSILKIVEEMKSLDNAASQNKSVSGKEKLKLAEAEQRTDKENDLFLPSPPVKSINLKQNVLPMDDEISQEVVSEDRTISKCRQDKSYSCMKCDATFSSLLTLTVHSQSSHTTEVAQENWEQCGKSYAQTLDLRECINPHLGNRPFNFGQCERPVIQSGVVSHHDRTQEEKHTKVHRRSHECPHCSEKFSLNTLLEDHIRMKHSEFVQHNPQSEQRSKRFGPSPSLQNHRVQDHSARDAEKRTCHECGITFKTESLLLGHIESHGFMVKPHTCEGLPFICSKCGKQFARSDAKKKHELKCQENLSQQSLLHVVSTPPAASCSNVFSDREANFLMSSPAVTQRNEFKVMEKFLESPKKCLDGNKPKYFCPDCGESFLDILSLSAHAEALNHASVEESCWICGLCSAAFLREHELTRHMKIHKDFLVDTQLPAHLQGQELDMSDVYQK